MTTINLINNTETFTLNGVVYTHHTETGRFSKTENGKTKRIGVTEYQVAEAEAEADELKAKLDTTMEKLGYHPIDSEWNDIRYSTCDGQSKVMAWNTVEEGLKWAEAQITEEDIERDARELERYIEEAEESNTDLEVAEIAEQMLDAEAEDSGISLEKWAEDCRKLLKKEKAKKARKSKDIAFTYTVNGKAIVTLTAKQVDFVKHLPDTCFWEHGLDSCIWIDCLCDEIKGQFAGKPMTVGAMISTICEKGLGVRADNRVNGKKCKSFALTELGKQVFASPEWGLN